MDPIVQQCLIIGAAALAGGLAYLVDAWWGNPTRRSARAHKWAKQQVASYEDEWLIPFEEQVVSSRRVTVVITFLFVLIFLEFPVDGQPYVAWLLALPAVYAIIRALTCEGLSLPPGTRVARLRELELVDYIPQHARVIMWFAGAVGFIACLLVALAGDKWLLAVSGSLVLAAPVCVELAGRRLARAPEPAKSAAHLYLQDALRADQVRGAAVSSVLSAAMLCNWLASGADRTDWVEWTLLLMNLVLLTGLFIVAFKPDRKAATYMRSRLWPQFGPGQLLANGEPLPPTGLAT
jgi:hypothetical protein